VRLFVAAEPSEIVRHASADAGRRLRAALGAKGMDRGIRWVPEENLHLTVWFLGEVSDQRATAVLDVLRPALAVPAFTLHAAGLGAFPPSGPPRVFWMGVTRGQRELSLLHDEVGARLFPWGFAAEGRSYSAHLTLARVKEPPKPAARAVIRQLLRDAHVDAGSCRIDALTVFRSRTSPRGSVYESLLRVPLA
jgi:RNA 2',3'-cyclic 3'-phosphodiesterase